MADPYRVAFEFGGCPKVRGIRRDLGLGWMTPLASVRSSFAPGFFVMPQSLSCVYAHVVFSTKDRRPFLQDEQLSEDLFAYQSGICKGAGCPAVVIGGHIDHVHLLVRLSRTTTIADLLRDLKRDSSAWVKSRGVRTFAWQGGYGVFSISPAHVAAISEYIRHQEEHHQTVSFQDEFRTLCRKYGLGIDERYVWD